MNFFRLMLLLTTLLLPINTLAAETFFVRTLGGPENDRIAAAVDVADVLYFAGVKDLTGLSSRGLLLATTLEGDVLFEKAFADPAGRPVEITALAARDSLLYAGETIGTWPASGEAFLMVLSLSGDILSQTVFRNDKQAFLNDLLPTADGGLLVLGTLVVAPDTIGNGWVARIGPDGSLLWQKDIGTRGNDTLSAAAERPGGGLVLAGGLGSGGDPFGTLQGWLVELDAGGNLLWQAGYEAAVGDSFSGVILDRDHIIAVGTFCDFCFFRGDGWIVNTDGTGNLIDAQFIGDFNFQGFDEIVAARPAAKGQGFTVLGSTDTIAGPSQQMWSASFDNRGALRWVRQIGGSGFEMAGALVMLPTGSTAFGGYTVADLNQDVYIGTLDRNGRNPSACDQVALTAERAFRDDGGMTHQVRAAATAVDATAVLATGTLVEDPSPTTVDRLICLE